MNRQWMMLVGLMLAVLPAGAALACKYAVRDVGFVTLNDAPYTLTIVFGNDATPDAIGQALADAEAVLIHSNVTVSVGRVQDAAAFRDAAGLAGDALPAAVLTAPDDRSAVIASRFEPGRLEAALVPLVRSPAREKLANELIDGFATVVVIEGTDATANARARAIAEDAIARITANLNNFDRVVEVGPSLRIVPAEQRQAERWLLWALNIPLAPAADPELAILFGQGRRLGPVLQGEALTPARLYSHLAIVAQDCECDLDRGWLYGKRFPLAWNDDHRQRTYEALGFDPENALVRAEVSRIISRGTNRGGVGSADPFVDDGGIGGLGLQIYDLGSPADPPAPPADAAARPPAGTTPDAIVDTTSRAATQATATDAGTAASTPPLFTVLLTLTAAGLLVGGGATFMLLRARGGGA